MKIRSVVYVLFSSVAGLALAASASAQPRPAPPTGLRAAPPNGERADRERDREHSDPHADPHADHREAAAQHRETEAQIRARVQKEQGQKFAQREVARKDAHAWETSREQRAAQERSEVASNWGDIAEQADAKAELATHAERMAQLNRILDVASDQHDAALTARTNAVIQREIARDVRVLQGIRTRVGGQ